MEQNILKQLELLQRAVTSIATSMITKDDVKDFVTKADLKEALDKQKEYLETALDKQAEDFGEVVSELFVKADEKKADRIEVEKLNKRITHIESKFAA